MNLPKYVRVSDNGVLHVNAKELVKTDNFKKQCQLSLRLVAEKL